MDGLELLAQNYFGNTRSGSLAGPTGAFIISVIAVGTVLLIRNMTKRLRRLPDSFADGGNVQAASVPDGPESR